MEFKPMAIAKERMIETGTVTKVSSNVFGKAVLMTSSKKMPLGERTSIQFWKVKPPLLPKT